MPDVPDPLAELDQMIRGMADLAKLYWAMYEAFIGEGFSESQAMQLATAHLAAQATPRG